METLFSQIVSVLQDFQPIDIGLSAATVAVAGIVRGFSGFGAAMVMIPLLSLIFDPQTALGLLTAMEIPANLQLLRFSYRHANWRQAAPMAAAAAFAMPVGAWILTTVDPELLRRSISLIVLALVAVLASGFRHNVERRLGADLAVGGVAGLLNGSTGLGGPPIIFYMLSGPHGPAAVRANITAFFQLGFLVVVTTYALYGVLTIERLILGLALAPAYISGIALGGRLFDLADEATFRRIAFVLLAIIGAGTLVR